MAGTGAEYAYKHLDMMYGRSGGGDEEWPLLGTWFARQAMHCHSQPLQSRTSHLPQLTLLR
jgi:hypothetical protein